MNKNIDSLLCVVFLVSCQEHEALCNGELVISYHNRTCTYEVYHFCYCGGQIYCCSEVLCCAVLQNESEVVTSASVLLT
jgi:hypothetical protein